MKNKARKQTSPAPVQAGDQAAARKLAQGLTLVPCWVINDDGQRVHSCRWVKNISRA